MSTKAEPLKDEGSRRQTILAGATAGLVSRFVIAPLDVIKIRLQLQTHSLSDPLSHHGVTGPIYKGTIRTFRHILREEGVRVGVLLTTRAFKSPASPQQQKALWKGNVPAECLYIAYGSIQFSTYRSTCQFLSSLPDQYILPDTAQSFIGGAIGGTAATTVTYPLDLLRTRFAAQGNDRVYMNLRGALRDITKQEGVAGFYRGLSAGIVSIIPAQGIFFAAYEVFKLSLSPVALPFGSGDAAAGVLAQIISKTATFPLDTVRKRLQVQGPMRTRYVHRNIPVYSGVVRTIRGILAREGVRSLYRGLVVSLIKSAPASAVTVWTYERVMALLLSTGIGGDG